MRSTDKMLLSFVAGVVTLVVIVVAVTMARPGDGYRQEDSPDDVTHNYLLALREEEYARAYALLATDLAGYPPDVQTFVRDIRSDGYRFGLHDEQTSLTVLSADIVGNLAFVTVRRSSYSSDLFGPSRYTWEFEMEVEHANGQWRIVGGDQYFIDCWTTGACREPRSNSSGGNL